jgi:hypothetical protein
MFEVDGMQYTLEEVQRYAAQKNMTVEEYISTYNLISVEPTNENFQQDGVAGAGAPSETAAPKSTELGLGTFLSEQRSQGAPTSPFIQQFDRTVKPRKGVRRNKDGSESTHLMAAEQLEDGSWVGFPTLFQNDDGTWVDKR